MESSIWNLLQHSFKDFKLPSLMLWLFGSLIRYPDCLCVEFPAMGELLQTSCLYSQLMQIFLSSWCMSVTVYKYSKLT
jgi:hypothetical protein